jgi:Novel toxin 15
MSASPAAAQAAADNQKFWTGIAKLPDEAQRSFWEAGAVLSGYIGENASPRTLTYDTSSPPPGMPWYERMFFYIGQSHINQAVTAQAQSKAIADGAGWLWGALQGDFNKSPTTGQLVTGGIISMIPIVDQVCDVRDVIANCIDLADAEARKDNAKWLALGLTCIGFVPEFGSAVKTVAKAGFKEGARLLDVLKHMEWVERNFKKLKVACPWGYAPIEWLRKYDWIGQFKKAGAAARKAFENALAKAQAAAKYAIGAIKTKLLQLVDLFKAIAAKIADTMAELGRKLKAKIDEMLGGAKKEAGNYGATPGTAPNKHAQGEKPPPKGPNKTARMDAHKPKCFKPGDDLKKNWKGDPQKLEKEFYEQLKGQEAGLNKMTVGEYLENRARFEQIGRGTGAAQEAARERLTDQINKSVLGSLERDGIVGKQAKELAAAKTKEIMGSLAALHDPDMVAGGRDQIAKIGDRSVNSSLGSQWGKEGRIAEMDKAAQGALRQHGPDAKMNVTLDRCK